MNIIDKNWLATHEADLERWKKEPGNVVDLWMIAVAPEARNQGIANHLTRLSLEVAKAKGFELAIIECTGFFSQSAAEKAGFKPMSELYYIDYKVDGEIPLQEVPSPHVKMIIYEKKLNEREI